MDHVSSFVGAATAMQQIQSLGSTQPTIGFTYMRDEWRWELKLIAIFIDCLQDLLSIFQAIPVIGTFSASLFKAKISLIQVIGGIGCTIVFCHLKKDKNGTQSWEHEYNAALDLTIRGIVSFSYSLIGLLSLGIVPLIYELIRTQPRVKTLRHLLASKTNNANKTE